MLVSCKWGSRGKEELFRASLMVRKGDQLRHQRWRCVSVNEAVERRGGEENRVHRIAAQSCHLVALVELRTEW